MRHLFPLRTKRRIPQLHQLVRPTQCSNSTYCSGYFTHIDKLAHLVFHIIYCNYKYLHLCKFIRIFKTAIKVYMYIINLSWTRWLENFLQSDQLKTLEKVSQSKYKYMYIYTHMFWWPLSFSITWLQNIHDRLLFSYEAKIYHKTQSSSLFQNLQSTGTDHLFSIFSFEKILAQKENFCFLAG